MEEIISTINSEMKNVIDGIENGHSIYTKQEVVDLLTDLLSDITTNLPDKIEENEKKTLIDFFRPIWDAKMERIAKEVTGTITSWEIGDDVKLAMEKKIQICKRYF